MRSSFLSSKGNDSRAGSMAQDGVAVGATPPVSAISAPEGNFRYNEPSTLSHPMAMSYVRILWVDDSGATNLRDTQIGIDTQTVTGVSQKSSSRAVAVPLRLGTNIGLKARLMRELRANCRIPLKKLEDAFPQASEHYRENGFLQLTIEEAPTSAAFSTSRWENVFVSKRVNVVLTVIAASVGSTSLESPHVGGSVSPNRNSQTGILQSPLDAEFGKRLAQVKALFQLPKFASSLRRCIVFDPPAAFFNTLDSDNFIIVKSSVPIKEIAESLMKEIASDIVHHVTSRILALSQAAGDKDAVVGFRTPMDKIDFGEQSLDPKSELHKVLRCRAAKRRGDLLLQLDSPDHALIAYGEMGLQSSDSLWIAAALESIASARYMEDKQLKNMLPLVRQLSASLQQPERLCDAQMMTEINLVDTGVRECIGRLRKSVSAIGNALPPLIKQRVMKEIEEPLQERSERFALSLASIRSLLQAGAEIPESVAFSPPVKDFRDNYEAIVALWFAEVELYLVEAFHQYRILQPRLFELEAELYLKLAWLRAEQKNVKKVLDAVADLSKTLKFVSPEASLRVYRIVPDICLTAGCKRKAVFTAVESSLRDKRAGNIAHSLNTLLRCARWCDVPIYVDCESGLLAVGDELQQDVECIAGSPSASPQSNQRAANSNPEIVVVALPQGQRGVKVFRPRNRTKFHVTLLCEILDVLSMINTSTSGLRCHVASSALFIYSDLMDAASQSQLLNVVRMESSKMPPYLPSNLVAPPILKTMSPQPLESHLMPQQVSMGGAVFTYIDKDRLKMTVLSLHGKKLSTDVVWVVGDVAKVTVTISNPFDVLLQLTSLSLHCELLQSAAAAAGAVIDGATPYDTNGVMLQPKCSSTHDLYVLPQRHGLLRILGIHVRIGQLEFLNPIEIPVLPSPLEVPVIDSLPRVECLFSKPDVELAAGQTVPLKITLMNIGDVPVDALTITAHSSQCQLVNCDGCRERQSEGEMSVVLSRLILQDALPMGPGDNVVLEALLVAPPLFQAVMFQHLLFRIDYSPTYEPPTAPPGVPPAVPVFAVVPRRILEAKLRLFTVPSLVVSDMLLSHDRRFIEVRVRNGNPSYTIELGLHGTAIVPFITSQQSSLMILAGAELILPLIEISKLPNEREHCVFHLPWVVRGGTIKHSQPLQSPFTGELVMNFVNVLKGVQNTEPLEDVLVIATFANESQGAEDIVDDTAPNDDMDLGSDTDAPFAPLRSEKHRRPELALQKHSQNWISVAPSRLPVSLPAIAPVAVQLCINAPWKRSIYLTIKVDVDQGSDIGMVSGPVKQRTLIGNDGAVVYDERFELCLFKTGEHFLIVTIMDDQKRMIEHNIRLHVEHAVDVER